MAEGHSTKIEERCLKKSISYLLFVRNIKDRNRTSRGPVRYKWFQARLPVNGGNVGRVDGEDNVVIIVEFKNVQFAGSHC